MKKFQITFKGQVYELDVEEIGSSAPGAAATKTVLASAPAPVAAPQTPVKAAAPKAAAAPVPAGAKPVLAPMPGKIFKMSVQKGDSVKRGDVVCILEAMKMENEIMASQDGKIADISVSVGQTVSTGDVLVVIG